MGTIEEIHCHLIIKLKNIITLLEIYDEWEADRKFGF